MTIKPPSLLQTPMKKLWPGGSIHLHLGAPLLYGMLRAVTAARSGSGCFEACGGGWSARQAARGCCEVEVRGDGRRESVCATRGGCRALTMTIAKADELPVHIRKGVGNQKNRGGYIW